MDPNQKNTQPNQNSQNQNDTGIDPAWLDSLNQDTRNSSTHSDSNQQQTPSPAQPQDQQRAYSPTPTHNPNTHPNMVSVSPEHPPVDIGHHENVPLVEVGHEMQMDPEVEEYMKRVEQDKINLNQPIVVHGNPVVHPAHWQPEETVALPTTKQTILFGLDSKVTESVRWLAEWCVRMVKKFHGKVVYSDAPTKE